MGIFVICYVRYKKRSRRSKEGLIRVISRKGRWISMIMVIMRVNVRLPILRNVIGERIVLREIMEKRGVTRRIRMICNLRFMMRSGGGERKKINRGGEGDRMIE